MAKKFEIPSKNFWQMLLTEDLHVSYVAWFAYYAGQAQSCRLSAKHDCINNPDLKARLQREMRQNAEKSRQEYNSLVSTSAGKKRRSA